MLTDDQDDAPLAGLRIIEVPSSAATISSATRRR